MADVMYAALAGILAGLTGYLVALRTIAQRAAAKRRAKSKAALVSEGRLVGLEVTGPELTIVRYLEGLERRLAHKATKPIAPALWMRGGSSASLALSVRYAGLGEVVSPKAIREAQLRLGLSAGGVGAVLGACISNELAVLFGLAGIVLGVRAPMYALRKAAEMRSASCKRDLPELLEVVSLGLRSGLTFDRSFQLYSSHFETGLARACSTAQQKWTLGLSTREEALQELANSYDSDLLHRVVDTVVRSMRFGTTLAADLEKAATDSQAEQRAARQEEVAKAPVRMMVPTTTLILPAMLLFVLGPVLLELLEGF